MTDFPLKINECILDKAIAYLKSKDMALADFACGLLLEGRIAQQIQHQNDNAIKFYDMAVQKDNKLHALVPCRISTPEHGMSISSANNRYSFHATVPESVSNELIQNNSKARESGNAKGQKGI